MGDKYWPIDPATPVTSPFGYRPGFDIPGSAAWQSGLHDGTDFAAPAGTPVYAAHAGAVRNLLDPGGYGQYVQIDGNGLMTQYGHVRDMWIVPDGTWVEPGTLIAGVGSEGMSTGPHLHFRLHVMNTPTDPIPWLADADWNDEGILDFFRQTTAVGQFLQWWVDNTDLPLPAIAGIAGNVQQESSFNPTIVEKWEQGYTLATLDRVAGPNAVAAGYGLYQHSFDRLWGDNGLFAWAEREGLDPHTMDTQNRFAVWEIKNLPRFAGLWDELMAVTDAHTGALVFGKFEGFNPAYEGLRNQYAVAIWDRIQAGEFGPLTRTTQPQPPRTFVPFTVGPEEDTMQIIRRPAPHPPLGVMLGVPFPIEDNSIDPEASGVTEVPMSDGVFQKLHRNWMDANGLKLTTVNGEWRYQRVPLPPA